jgi:crotonobetainyl-CoA:carnitine CoA-transferase CaiB-like acyl-CoA transferase
VLDPELTAALDLDLDGVALDVATFDDVFGSPFRVTEAAVACAAAFVGSVADLEAHRAAAPAAARLDGLHAAVSFHSERLITAEHLPRELWAPLSGNYRAADGWVRIHANLARHAAAAREVLGLGRDDPPGASVAVARWNAGELVDALQAAGGVAAVLRRLDEWRGHPHHLHLRERAVVERIPIDEGASRSRTAGSHLDGVRVLDCTRVIAGPVAGRLLASFGAEVVKVDAPLDDSPTLELDTGWGKTRVPIDLRDHDDRARFDDLVRRADVLLDGFRPGVLAALGYDDQRLRTLRPGLIVGHLSAFGAGGPLGGMRGFDSIVQIATGLAHAVSFDPEKGPGALPAQALDHGAGHLLASGIVRALRSRRSSGIVETVEVSLARIGEWLVSLGPGTGQPAADLEALAEPYLRTIDEQHFGTVRHVTPVGRVATRGASWPRHAITPRQPKRAAARDDASGRGWG